VLRADVLPFGECAHVVGAHVAEGHGRGGRRIWHGRTIAEDEARRGLPRPPRANPTKTVAGGGLPFTSVQGSFGESPN